MAIKFICSCGTKLSAKDARAGRKTRCPNCGEILRIPERSSRGADAPDRIRFVCQCGKRIRARPEQAGHKVGCPRCGRALRVPMPGTPRQASSAHEPASARQARHRDDDMLDSEIEVDMGTDDDLASPPRAQAPPALGGSAVDEDEDAEAEPTDLDIKDLAPVRPSLALRVDVGHPTQIKCASCGAMVPKDAVICTQCGINLDTGALVAMDSDLGSASREMGDIGIRSSDLTKYFNARGPVEAAVAGIYQVMNGFKLYLPYAGLLAAGLRLAGVLRHYSSGNETVAALLGLGSGAFAIFMWVGFVGCIKDSVFQRPFGIDRFAYHGVVHWVRFTVSALLTSPLWVGWWCLCSYLFASLVGLSMSWWVKAPLGLAMLCIAGGVGLGLMFIPHLAILERIGPIQAVVCGGKFVFWHWHKLLGLSLTMIFVGGVSTGGVWLIFNMARLMLWATLPALLYDTIRVMVVSFAIAGFWGEMLASLMIMYLSHQEDHNHLRDIQRKIKGPYGRAWLVKVAWVGAIALPVLFGWWEQRLTGGSVFVNAGKLLQSHAEQVLGE